MNKNSSHYKKALKSIKNNNVSNAMTELKLCLKFNPKSVPVLNLLGLAYYLKCRFDKAEKYWRKSLSQQRENNKARDYLELITKKDFEKIRKEYKKILFNANKNRNQKVKFLKGLIEEYDELIEPYVILALVYKKENNYQEALKYLYQAYDLDSGSKNIKNYILECEKKEEENTKAFNFSSSTNQKSALIAGAITLVLIVVLVNASGFDFQNILTNKSENIDLSQGSIENQSETSMTTPNNDNTDFNNTKTSENKKDNTTANEFNFAQQSKRLNNESSSNSFSSNLNLMNYINTEAMLSLAEIKELKEEEKRNDNLKEANKFLEEGTEQDLFNLAMDYFKSQDYQNSSELFYSIYKLSQTEYLKRESLFLLARSYDKMDNYQASDQFYRIYLNEYQNTNYYDEALYNLGLMLKRAGKTKESKEVLQRLQEERPYSEYNNSQVYKILNN